MTTINDIGDLVRILREQPEWAEALRGVLLSRELLELPEKFADFVQLTTTNFETVNRRLEQMESDVGELKADVGGIKADIRRIEGKVDNGLGPMYEMKVEKNIYSHAGQQLGLRSTRVLLGILNGRVPELAELAEQAIENGVITWEQNDDLWLSDLIFTGRARTDGTVMHIAAEVSVTVGDHDIERAAERAKSLSLIIGVIYQGY